MNPISYSLNPWLTAFSAVLGLVCAFAVLEVAARVRLVRSARRFAWMSAGAGLGVGLWTVHLVAMLSWQVHTPVLFHSAPLLSSAVCAVAAAAVGMHAVTRSHAFAVRLRYALAAGVLLNAMHYLSLGHLPAVQRVEYDVFLASLAAAAGFAAPLLGITWSQREQQRAGADSIRERLLAVVAMAALGAVMVYGSLLSLTLYGETVPDAAKTLAGPEVALLAGGLLLILVAVTTAGAYNDRRATQRAAELAALTDVVRQLTKSPDDARRAVCAATVALCGADAAGICELDHDGTLRMTASHGVAPLARRLLSTEADSDAVTSAMREDAFVLRTCVPDGESGALSTQWLPGARAVALRRITRGSTPVGLLLVGWRHQPADHERARRSIGVLADEAALAIHWHLATAERETSARVEARTRIARDLHDSVSQELATTATYAQLAQQRLREDPDGAEALLAQVVAELAQARTMMRRVLRSLRTGQEFEFRLLSELLGSLTTDFERRVRPVKVVVRRELEGDEPARPDIAEAFYYLLREILHNIEKHAHASEVHVALIAGDDELRLTVTDDGVGFDVAEHEDESFGLVGIRERVQSLGGKLSVRSRPGEGTLVSLTLPDPHADPNDVAAAPDDIPSGQTAA